MSDRTCLRCGASFNADNGGRGEWKRFCSSECAEAKPPADHPTCDVVDCTRPTRAAHGGHCEMHYYRLRRTGSLGTASSTRRERGTCRHDECERPDSGDHGWCRLHAQRIRLHGDPDTVAKVGPQPGEDCPFWKGDDVGYSAVHTRLRKERGPATGYPCADCGTPAGHWSYDHTDPNEKRSNEGPFSTDLDHYSPRCVPCHKAHDLAQAA